MKARNIILGLSLLLCAGSAATQISLQPGYGVEALFPRFYDETRTFYGHGFVYQADVDVHGDGMVVLYNRDAARFLNTRQTFRDGTGIPLADRHTYLSNDVVRMTNRPMMDLAERIVIEGFSRDERLRLKPGAAEALDLSLIICPDTGRVKEVYFEFPYDSGLATIPVSTFRRMEVAIKEQVRFTPTDFGRSLNFIFRGWLIEIPPYVIQLTLTPLPTRADPDPVPVLETAALVPRRVNGVLEFFKRNRFPKPVTFFLLSKFQNLGKFFYIRQNHYLCNSKWLFVDLVIWTNQQITNSQINK